MRPLFLKRMLDLVGATVLLVLASPVMLVVAALVRVRMGRPILFRQIRPGYKARPFKMYKFRTMCESFGPDGQPLPESQRLTRLGRLLRETSLDELPQLWNVLQGEMSLVGPRPLVERLAHTPEQARRRDVKPGLTGWAQVNGRNLLSWDEKLALDAWYVDHWNLWLDIRIIWLTVWIVLRRDGITRPEPATMRQVLPGQHGVEAGRYSLEAVSDHRADGPHPVGLSAQHEPGRESSLQHERRFVNERPTEAMRAA